MTTKERPILFDGEMVKAILAGTKTQMRRVIKPQPDTNSTHLGHVGDGPCVVLAMRGGMYCIACPYGRPGDYLWVRETWGCPSADHIACKDGRKPQPGDELVYRADPADDYQWGPGRPSQGGFCWRPSIHMPRWASRITLEITGIRVERVREISQEDAKAEEAPWLLVPPLWDSTNARRPGCSWADNPYCWVIAFRRIKP